MPRSSDPEKEISRLLDHIAALETERDDLKTRNLRYQMLVDDISDKLGAGRPTLTQRERTFDGITFVIAYFDIPQQIERTLTSCAPSYQNSETQEIEVILVDNGSRKAPADDLQERFPHVKKIIRIEDHPSPVNGLNAAVQAARFDTIGIMIDGAHILSPGVVENTSDIVRLFESPVINVPQYILGKVSQNLSRAEDDAFEREGAELKKLGWPNDGYRLFDYAVYPGENYTRSYFSAVESNCLITTRAVLDACGGFDERFDEPGAGFANLELFSRLINNPNNDYILLPGEGTFHQDHRGVTTQKSPDERDQLVKQYQAKYETLTGTKSVLNAKSPFLYGIARRSTQNLPTISREYGRTAQRICRQLASIYTVRAQAGMTDTYTPELAVGGSPDERLARTPLAPVGLAEATAEKYKIKQSDIGYMRCLKTIHDRLEPDLYFEIGIDTGTSLSLAKCKSVGVDPGYFISNRISASCQLFRETSDAFFADQKRTAGLLGDGVDLAFIDGMHLAENVLRDFINVEKWMSKDGIVVFDDVLPEQPEMWERERRFAAWCGDVYKVIPILREYRPDLTIHVVEAFVGPYRKGLAIVSGLNPEDTTLSDSLLTLEEDILGDRYNAKDVSALEAMVQVSDFKILKDIKRSDRANGLGKEKHRQSASVKLRSTSPQQTQKISLVLCAFNMSRELPRTLKSLLPSMQSGVRSAEYELIVVDNGSSPELSIDDLNPEQTDVRLIRVDDAAVSPCAAINRAVERTDGNLVGIMVDGARLASPGLLTSAFDGLALSERALFGVHGYHLGDDIQQRSSQLGYDQDAEDDLLRSIEWEKDGYRLFEVSVPSKSSGKGLFTLPSESNAVFMHRDFWHELGGYDERFESPGGGLANLDFWKRACEADGAQPVIALSEGTFHQFHGGTSTDGENTLREHFHSEYERIRGQKYLRPNTKPIFIGPPNPFVLKHLEQNRISDNAAR